MKKYLPVIISSILSVALFVYMSGKGEVTGPEVFFCNVIAFIGAAMTFAQLLNEMQLKSDEAERLADENVELKQMRNNMRDLEESLNSVKMKQQLSGTFGG